MEWRVTRFPILASTNDLALAWIRSGTASPGDVLLADEQTSGRGRPGRVWHSAKGALLLTVVLPFRPERAGWSALAAGMAVALAARDLGAPAGVKWPNDVVLEGRKLAGILVETSTTQLAAVGVGLNVVNAYPKDPAVAAKAIRLADRAAGVTVDAVLERVLLRLGECWEMLHEGQKERLRGLWAELDSTTGRRVRWSEAPGIGTAEGVEADGALRLRLEDGRVVAARVGEVTFEDG